MKKGDVDAAFEEGGLPAPERLVDIRQPDVVSAAIVAGETAQAYCDRYAFDTHSPLRPAWYIEQ